MRGPHLLAPLVAALVLLLPALSPLQGQAREEILSYDVVLQLGDGNRLTVTEEITVRALRFEINRGIYRDFPTSFPRSSGLGRIEAPFEVLEVTRDGAPEPYTLSRIGGPDGRGGVRIRIGDEDVFLQEGVYRYRIRYETWRWITFGEGADQLYWNVTGNGWLFPILRATARLEFPRDVDPDELGFEVWTGFEGSTMANASTRWDADAGVALFETTAPLGPYEGMTLRLTFPRGGVEPPTAEQEAAWARLDWGGPALAGGVILLVLSLYLVMWMRVGRDPGKGIVVVRYEPPQGYSPAALGFLHDRGYQQRQLAAALVSLAVKGMIFIEQKKSEWTIRPANSRGSSRGEPLSPEEEELLGSLLAGRRSLTLSASESTTVRTAMTELRQGLARRMEREYFVLNRNWFMVGLSVSILGFLLLAWRERYGMDPAAWFLGLWLTVWTVGTGTLFFRVFQGWGHGLRSGGAANWVGILFFTAFATPFLLAEVVMAVIFVSMVPWSLVLAAIALGALNILFYHLLERPTLRGRGVLDSLAGFKQFLTAVDADRLDRMMPPSRTPALFERYLPHAIALGVENRWAEGFKDVLTPQDLAESGHGRRSTGPLSWYAGNGSTSLGGLASSLGASFSSSLSSASSPPSSGGSGGGGGSSGGGGGGGGGAGRKPPLPQRPGRYLRTAAASTAAGSKTTRLYPPSRKSSSWSVWWGESGFSDWP